MTETRTGRIVSTKRMGTSLYGNPIYMVAIELGNGQIDLRKTEANSGLAYGINNPEFRDNDHVFTLNHWGNIRTADCIVPNCR